MIEAEPGSCALFASVENILVLCDGHHVVRSLSITVNLPAESCFATLATFPQQKRMNACTTEGP